MRLFASPRSSPKKLSPKKSELCFSSPRKSPRVKGARPADECTLSALPDSVDAAFASLANESFTTDLSTQDEEELFFGLNSPQKVEKFTSKCVDDVEKMETPCSPEKRKNQSTPVSVRRTPRRKTTIVCEENSVPSEFDRLLCSATNNGFDEKRVVKQYTRKTPRLLPNPKSLSRSSSEGFPKKRSPESEVLSPAKRKRGDETTGAAL